MKRVAFILPILISLATGAQITETKQVYYDTLNLLIPKPEKKDIARSVDYKHCADLTSNTYRAVIHGKATLCKDSADFARVLRLNKRGIIDRKFNVILSAKTDYDKIVSVIGILMDNKIGNYGLLSKDGDFGKADPVVIASDHPFTKDVSRDDPALLLISMVRDSLKVSFKGEVGFYSVAGLDIFIATNKKTIDPDKIMLTAPSTARYAAFEPVMAILTKHNYFNVHMIAD